MSEIILATKTKEAIDAAIYQDQGRLYRHHLRECILDVDDAYDDSPKDRFRSHLGISMSGRECARELWYKFRWATTVAIGGRMLRLFNRGHLEEPRFVAMLRTIGATVWQVEAPGQQFRVSLYGGHYGSALDGVVKGIPEMPDEPMLGEFKTHNNKSFHKLAGEIDGYGTVLIPPQGVRVGKVEHWAQMQQYMGHYKLRFGLYCAVNKDTDELYFEIVPYERQADEGYRERSYNIIFTREAPPRISPNPSFWRCKYCDERKVCHMGAAPDFNCRTCAASRPLDDGTWSCSTYSCIIDKERQLTGCPDWQIHPSFQTHQ
jgi:hypothetical protein